MVNKILSMNIPEGMSLVYRISKNNIIHEVFKFIIRNYSNRSWVRMFRQLYEPGYMTCICCTPRRMTIRYHHYEKNMPEAAKCQA